MTRNNEGEFEVMCAAVQFIAERDLLVDFHKNFARLVKNLGKSPDAGPPSMDTIDQLHQERMGA